MRSIIASAVLTALIVAGAAVAIANLFGSLELKP